MNQEEKQEEQPSRHPILERLDLNDYDFNGQSLDYEPNLEFDDTDLKQELEEELEQLNGNILRLSLSQRNHASRNGKQEDPFGAPSSSSSSTPSELKGASASGELAEASASNRDPDECRPDDEEQQDQGQLDRLFLSHLEAQLEGGLSLNLPGERQAYLESPDDLLEENFEEAFKSSLLELEQGTEWAGGANERLKMKRRKLLLRRRGHKSAPTKAGTKFGFPFFKLIQQQQLGGTKQQEAAFYVSKQGDLLGDKLELCSVGSADRLGAAERGVQSAESSPEWASKGARTLAQQVFREAAGEQRVSSEQEDEGEEEEEEDYDEQLMSELYDYDLEDDFSDIAQYNCVEVAGDDFFGRRIITIYACRLPDANKVHHLRLLKYIMYTLDQYVENDYCVVYFHYGLNSQNKPKLNFLYQAYRAFDRKYKKNLKALFLVHPTNFIRIVWQLFKPIIRSVYGTHGVQCKPLVGKLCREPTTFSHSKQASKI